MNLIVFFNKQQEACKIILPIFLREENQTHKQNNWVIKDMYNTVYTKSQNPILICCSLDCIPVYLNFEPNANCPKPIPPDTSCPDMSGFDNGSQDEKKNR